MMPAILIWALSAKVETRHDIVQQFVADWEVEMEEEWETIWRFHRDYEQ